VRPTPPPPQRVLDMDEKNWWDFWNKSYRSDDGKDAVSSELFARVARVISEITEPKNCRVLEIACGSGTLSRMLSCSAYHGIDISPAAIEIARQRSNDSRLTHARVPTYEAGDFHEWTIPREPFDLVLCIDAISCFRDQQLTLRKMAASLGESGRLVVTTINPFVYNRIKRTRSTPIQDGPVSHWLARAELHALIRSAGLAIERSHTIMPRGNRGILRIINSRHLNHALGSRAEDFLKRLKEQAGLGQYRLVVARKEGRV
jgi:2-polyprenyl-3-methyl-5-hydroxy-6-metoxy-1,4-benzoquinol methylase